MLSRAKIAAYAAAPGPISVRTGQQDIDRIVRALVVPDDDVIAVLGKRESLRRKYSYVRDFSVVRVGGAVRWLLPTGNSSCSAAIRNYVPFGMKGKVLKRALYTASRVRALPRVTERLILASDRPSTLDTIIRNSAGEHNFELAVTVGTNGTYQKLTVQVLTHGGQTVGFLKVPLAHAATGRIRNEALGLRMLSGEHSLRCQLPSVLYDGAFGEGHCLFQTAAPESVAMPTFNAEHESFLKTLQAVRSSCRPLSEVADEVREKWILAGSPTWPEVDAAFALAARRSDVEVECAIAHGDFAPWNLRMHAGRIFAFDWESWAPVVPSLWDMFHFHVQTASLLKHSDARLHECAQRSVINRILFLLYLIHSVSQALLEATPNASQISHRRELLQKYARNI